MSALEHSARVAAARKVLDDTERTPRSYEEACLDRHRLRAALEETLSDNTHLLAIVGEAVRNETRSRADREAMDRYRAAMNRVGRP
jgi:hypothetical protein